MDSYDVLVRLELPRGITPEMAEVEPEDVRDHHFCGIAARDEDQAAELALDEFHLTIPIGVLDDVIITTGVTRHGEEED